MSEVSLYRCNPEHALHETPSLISEKVSTNSSHTSIPAQIRHIILYISNNQGWVDGFVREFTSAKRLHQHFL